MRQQYIIVDTHNIQCVKFNVFKCDQIDSPYALKKFEYKIIVKHRLFDYKMVSI